MGSGRNHALLTAYRLVGEKGHTNAAEGVPVRYAQLTNHDLSLVAIFLFAYDYR